jgi:hypothetical protein
MTFRRISLALVAVAMLALPAAAGAVKIPTYFIYGTGCTKSAGCRTAIYTNSSNKQIVAFNFSPKCKTKGSTFSASLNSGSLKINSKHKYSGELTANSYDQGAAQGTPGKVTISGKVTKKDKATLKYSVDATSTGCSNITKGTLTLKYKGSQQGG